MFGNIKKVVFMLEEKEISLKSFTSFLFDFFHKKGYKLYDENNNPIIMEMELDSITFIEVLIETERFFNIIIPDEIFSVVNCNNLGVLTDKLLEVLER